MQDGTDVLEHLKRLLAEPDPLDPAAEALLAGGAWARWSTDRQLWYLRMQRRLTQSQLAAASGVGQARISRLEAGGDFKWSTLKALWAALGVEPLLWPDASGRPREGRPWRKGRSLGSARKRTRPGGGPGRGTTRAAALRTP